MYLPDHFAETRPPILHGLIAQHPLAALVANTAQGIVANHVPLLLDPARGPRGTLKGHIARANPLWRQVPAGAEVLAIFQGAQHYVSPRWYPSKQEHGKVVPTWNYAVVHARGSISWRRDARWLKELVVELTETHEAGAAEPWHVSDAPADYIAKMLGAIIGFEIEIQELSGKWKVSQNRPLADRRGVAAGLANLPGDAARDMAALVPGQDDLRED